MDPFSEDDEPSAAGEESGNWSTVTARPVATLRRPWWRWNPITLAGVLFVVLWVRELGGLPLGATGLLVATIFAAWALTPIALLGTSLLTLPPALPETAQPGTKGPRVWRAGAACRVAAVLILAVGFVHSYAQASWVLDQSQANWVLNQGITGRQPSAIRWTLLTSVTWEATQSLVIAIGLWTIGGIALRVEDLAAAEAERDADR